MWTLDVPVVISELQVEKRNEVRTFQFRKRNSSYSISVTIDSRGKIYRNLFVQKFSSYNFCHNSFCRNCRNFRVIGRKLVERYVNSFMTDYLRRFISVTIDPRTKTYMSFSVGNCLIYIFCHDNFGRNFHIFRVTSQKLI